MRNKINIVIIGVILLSFLFARGFGTRREAGSADNTQASQAEESLEDGDSDTGELEEDGQAEEEAAPEMGINQTDAEGDGEDSFVVDTTADYMDNAEANADIVKEEMEAAEQMAALSEEGTESDQETDGAMLRERILARSAFRSFIAGKRPVYYKEDCLIATQLKRQDFPEKTDWSVEDLMGAVLQICRSQKPQGETSSGAAALDTFGFHYGYVRSGPDGMPHLAFCYRDLTAAGADRSRDRVVIVINYDPGEDRLTTGLITDAADGQEVTVNSRGIVAKKWTSGGVGDYDRFFTYYYCSRSGAVRHFYSSGYRSDFRGLSGQGGSASGSVCFTDCFLQYDPSTRTKDTHPEYRTLHLQGPDPAVDRTFFYEPAYLYEEDADLFSAYQGSASRVTDNVEVIHALLEKAADMGTAGSAVDAEEPAWKSYSPFLSMLYKIRRELGTSLLRNVQ